MKVNMIWKTKIASWNQKNVYQSRRLCVYSYREWYGNRIFDRGQCIHYPRLKIFVTITNLKCVLVLKENEKTCYVFQVSRHLPSHFPTNKCRGIITPLRFFLLTSQVLLFRSLLWLHIAIYVFQKLLQHEFHLFSNKNSPFLTYIERYSHNGHTMTFLTGYGILYIYATHFNTSYRGEKTQNVDFLWCVFFSPFFLLLQNRFTQNLSH